MGNEGAAEVVAGPEGSIKEIKGLDKAFVAQVGDVEDDAEPRHFTEEVAPARVEAAGRGRAMGIDAGAVVGGADGAEAVVP